MQLLTSDTHKRTFNTTAPTSFFVATLNSFVVEEKTVSFICEVNLFRTLQLDHDFTTS